MDTIFQSLLKMDRTTRNKVFSEILEESKYKIDKLTCKTCSSTSGKQNSHTIPESIMRNISEKGYLYTSFAFGEISQKFTKNQKDDIKELIYKIKKPKEGVGKLNTFRYLCSKCENTKFKNYESKLINGDNMFNSDIRELELKNLLFMYYKKDYSRVFMETSMNKLNEDITYLQTQNFLNPDYVKMKIENIKKSTDLGEKKVEYLGIDVDDLINEIKMTNDSIEQEYKILIDETLSYKVNFAISIGVLPVYNSKNSRLLYTTNSKYFEQNYGYLHIGVFPLKDNRTRVLVFYNSKYHHHLAFIKKDIEKAQNKLKLISDYILLYSEDYVFNSQFKREVENQIGSIISNLSIIDMGYQNQETYKIYKHAIKNINIFKM